MSEVKISEIIINLDKEIKEIKEQVLSIDNNVKIILSILNKNYKLNEKENLLPNIEKSSILLPHVTEAVEENLAGSIVVQQLVIYADKSPVRLAKVEIKSGDKLIRKIYSGHNGKWISRLNPGEYEVTISKADKVSKNKVEVLVGESPQELFAFVLG